MLKSVLQQNWYHHLAKWSYFAVL